MEKTYFLIDLNYEGKDVPWGFDQMGSLEH